MKVAYFATIFPKASETFVRDEVAWMNARGWLRAVIALNVNTQLLAVLDKSIRNRTRAAPLRYVGRLERLKLTAYWLVHAPRRFHATRRSLPSDPDFIKYFWNAAVLAKGLSPLQIQIIHAHFASPAAQLARYVSRITGIPFTVCVHHYDLFYQPPPNYPALTRDAATLLTISDYNRSYLAAHYRLPAAKIRVLYCGVNLKRFQRDKRCNAQSAISPTILSVGRLAEIKAQRDLIEACAIMAQRGARFTLKIIGEGKLRAALEARIANLGLRNEVVLMGEQPSNVVCKELRQADIFVLPSLSEGIPVALMEAMATELAVVATRVRGIPELIEHKKTGLLVEPQAPKQLAQAMSALIANPDLRSRLGCAARAKVAAQFNAEVQYEKLVEIWREKA